MTATRGAVAHRQAVLPPVVLSELLSEPVLEHMMEAVLRHEGAINQVRRAKELA